jgi:murein L,D-transpeptidase YafK
MKNSLRIEIEKNKRKLSVFDGERRVSAFEVAFGVTPVGSKEVRDDGKTPEGEYLVCVKNPKSKYHLSLCLNYPNIQDAERGLAAGQITQEEHDAIIEAVLNGRMPPQDTRLGGEIYIHGGGTDGDWTQGCIGLADEEMTELFEIAVVGTKVAITP